MNGAMADNSISEKAGSSLLYNRTRKKVIHDANVNETPGLSEATLDTTSNDLDDEGLSNVALRDATRKPFTRSRNGIKKVKADQVRHWAGDASCRVAQAKHTIGTSVLVFPSNSILLLLVSSPCAGSLGRGRSTASHRSGSA
jgi:hypothetical protein